MFNVVADTAEACDMRSTRSTLPYIYIRRGIRDEELSQLSSIPNCIFGRRQMLLGDITRDS